MYELSKFYHQQETHKSGKSYAQILKFGELDVITFLTAIGADRHLIK